MGHSKEFDGDDGYSLHVDGDDVTAAKMVSNEIKRILGDDILAIMQSGTQNPQLG